MNIIFDPPSGLAEDGTLFDEGGKWIASQHSNVRWVNDKPEVIGGWTSHGSAVLSGTPKNIIQWTISSGSTYEGYGTTTKLYVYDGTYHDVTPAALPTGTNWSLQTYGDDLMSLQSGAKLYQWTGNVANPSVVVTNAPIQSTAMLVTPERQVLLFGTKEEVSTNFNGLCIRGSDIENPTNWTTDASNNAFEHILEGPGKIIAARMVGQYVAVLTSESLHVGQFIGDPGQAYRFDRVGSGCGCLGIDACVSVNGVLYWMTHDYRIFAWAPGGNPVQLPCPIMETIQSNMNTSKTAAVRTFATYNSKFGEIWFFHPSGSSSSANPTRYVAFSIKDGTWFQGVFSRTAMAQGITFLIGADSSGNTYYHETGKHGTSGSLLTWSVGSGYLYGKNAERRFQVLEVWADFWNQVGNVTLTVGAFEYPSAGGSATQTVTFTTSDQRKSIRISGRLIQVVFSGNDGTGATDTFAGIGKTVFKAEELGLR